MEVLFIKRMVRLSVAMLAAISIFAVGCDDGGKRRQPLKKNEATGDAKATGSAAGDGAGPAATQSGAPAADSSQQAEHDQVSSQIQELAKDSLLNKNDLVEGTYKLVSIGTGFKFYKAQKLEVTAFRMQNITLDIDENVNIDNDQPTQSAGLLTEDADSGRNFEIPYSFEVTKSSGHFLAERQAFKQFFTFSTALKSAAVNGQTSVHLENILGSANPSSAAIKSSVQALLATDGVENGQDLKYTVDDGGVSIDLRIHKVSDSRIHLNFEVSEEKDVKLRFVTLVYDITPKAAPETTDTTTDMTSTDPTSSTDMPPPESATEPLDDDQAANL